MELSLSHKSRYRYTRAHTHSHHTQREGGREGGRETLPSAYRLGLKRTRPEPVVTSFTYPCQRDCVCVYLYATDRLIDTIHSDRLRVTYSI